MTVAEIMTDKVVTTSMDASLDSARRLFETHRFRHLLVVDGGKLVGVISDRDILREVSPFVGRTIERELDEATLHKRAHQIMSRRLVTVPPGGSIRECARLMLENRVSCLPVVDESHRVLGIVTWKDLLGALLRESGAD